VVSDPREEQLPDVGFASVCDAESGREVLVDTRSKLVRERYARAARDRIAERKQIFRRTKVDTIEVRTDRPYVEEIYRFFRMRERRYA
ncbi:MAG: DUF58 domain-containing protein, partial [Candidatus Hydrogenedentes bacterium]|nr:DUF58 domain-containing protein [Candidatus Hydrogenedentota bacterium]